LFKSQKFEIKILKHDFQEYLRRKIAHKAKSSSTPSVSTCVSQSIANPSTWIVDLGASHHIVGNASLLSFGTP